MWISAQMLTKSPSELINEIKDLINKGFLFYAGWYFELNDDHTEFRFRYTGPIPYNEEEKLRAEYELNLVKALKL